MYACENVCACVCVCACVRASVCVCVCVCARAQLKNSTHDTSYIYTYLSVGWESRASRVPASTEGPSSSAKTDSSSSCESVDTSGVQLSAGSSITTKPHTYTYTQSNQCEHSRKGVSFQIMQNLVAIFQWCCSLLVTLKVGYDGNNG